MATVSRGVAVLLVTSGVAAGCTSSGSGATSSPPPNTSSGSGATSGPCTLGTAVHAKFTYVDARGFTPSCVKIKRGGQFLFINNDRKQHNVSTQRGAPTAFNVELPKKTSTYAAVYKKSGKYVVVDSTTNETMTLFVG